MNAEDDSTGERSFAWPDVPRLVFGPARDHLNADVRHARESADFRVYAEGYLRAAEALFGAVVNERLNPGYAVYPLAFLWRHHIELQLKHIIVKGQTIKRWENEPLDDEGFPETHRLPDLWAKARPFIVVWGGGTDPHDDEVLKNVEANLTEMDRIDPNSTGVRYPVHIARKARQGEKPKKRKSVSPPNFPDVVNVGRLHVAMQALANFCDGILSCQEQALDDISDAELENLCSYDYSE